MVAPLPPGWALCLAVEAERELPLCAQHYGRVRGGQSEWRGSRGRPFGFSSVGRRLNKAERNLSHRRGGRHR